MAGPQFRSQARQGSMPRPIQAPDKGTPKYKRGLEKLKALEKEAADKSERNEKYAVAMEKKHIKEKRARDQVEADKDRSIKQHRAQLEANAKLAADFAEMEAKQAYNNMSAIANFSASAAQSVVDIKANRDKYNQEQTAIAIQKSKLTWEELNSAVKLGLNADQMAMSQLPEIIKVRERLGWDMYNKIAHRGGVYAVALSRWSMKEKVNSLPEWTTVNMNEKLSTGYSLVEALTSDTISSVDRAATMQEAKNKSFKDLELDMYAPHELEKVIGNSFDNHWNQLSNKSTAAAERKAKADGEQILMDVTWSELEIPGQIQRNVSLFPDSKDAKTYMDEKARGLRLLIGSGAMSLPEAKDAIARLRDIRMKVNGESVSYGDQWPGSINKLEEAVTERQIQLNRGINASLTAERLQTKVQVQETLAYVDSLQTDEDKDKHLQQEANDQSKSLDYRNEMRLYSNQLNAGNAAQSKQIAERIEQQIVESGVPWSPAALQAAGVTGSELLRLTKKWREWSNSGDKQKYDEFKFEVEKSIRDITKSYPLQTGSHKQEKAVVNWMMRLYDQTYQATKNDRPDAHKHAMETVTKLLKEGTEGDQASRTGYLRFVHDGDDPTKGIFSSFHNDGETTPTESIDWGENIAKNGAVTLDMPKGVFNYNTLNAIKKRTDINGMVMRRAAEVAAATTTEEAPVTAIGVILRQMYANNVKPPAFLVQANEAQQQLIKQSNNPTSLLKTFNNVGLIGEQKYLQAQAQTSLGVAVTPTYTGDRDGRQTGTDFRLPGGQGAEIKLPFDVTIVQSQDGFPTTYIDGTTDRRGASGSGFGHNVGGLLVTLPNGRQVELMLGHLNGVSPLAGLPIGTLVPAGTLIGSQGASGRSVIPSGLPWDHITAHADGVNGYKATPEDLMWIVNNLFNYSRGTANIGQAQGGIRV